MANLQISGLSKSFGRTPALTDLSLSVKDGEFLILLGPTGAGKTTTLRCIAGLEKPERGSILLDGVPADGLSPAERDVALVFQSYALYPRKTVFENMAFPLEARSLSPEQIRARVTEIARKLRIKSLLERKPAQLSGGQQQRVALGRAMVRQPRLFLMDEPLTNLDFKLRVEMRAELKRLQQELNATFFYVTNDQVEAMAMADRIAVLNRGLLQQVDTPDTVYQHPANQFVATFIGSPRMNLIDCHLERDRLVSADSLWQIPLKAGAADRMAGHNRLNLGIRAEDISLSDRAEEGAIAGTVYVAEPLGDRTIVDVHVGAASVKVKAPPTFEAAPGQALWLRLDPDRLHLFDQATGAAIQ